MSRADIVVVAGYLVRCPLGGYAWQALHYLAGLRALGFDAWFYEDTAYYPDCFDPTTGNMHVAPDAGVAFAAEFFGRFGFGDRWVFWDAQGDRNHGAADVDRQQLLADARVVVSLAAVNRLPRRPRQRKVFIDIDPAYTQIRLAQGDRGLGELVDEHDVLFTFGENIGRPACRIPTAGFPWHPTRQPVALDLWQPAPPVDGAAFTTVGRWDESSRDLEFDGETYRWRKRDEWLKFLDLPARSGARFAPALDIAKSPGDAEILRRHGWEFADAVAVSRDAIAYRDFIRASRGEFTVAKGVNIRLASGWFSDRGACYLAAGRPVINQDTGFDRVLPSGKGLFSVRDVDDAVRAAAAIAADYPGHSAAARRIAADCFDARRVLGDILARLP